MWGAKLEHKRSLPCMCDEMSEQGDWWHFKGSINCSQSHGAWLQHTQGVSPPQLLGVYGNLFLPLWNRCSSKVKILIPTPSWREKNCLFQPGNLSFKCLIKAVLFRWGRGKCLSGICGNGCVFGHELTLVPPSTTGGEMFSHHPLLAQWYQEQESVQKGQEKHLLWSFLFERHSTGLIAKEREYYIYWKKNAAPSFPSFSFSERFESLDIFYL